MKTQFPHVHYIPPPFRSGRALHTTPTPLCTCINYHAYSTLHYYAHFTTASTLPRIFRSVRPLLHAHSTTRALWCPLYCTTRALPAHSTTLHVHHHAHYITRALPRLFLFARVRALPYPLYFVLCTWFISLDLQKYYYIM